MSGDSAKIIVGASPVDGNQRHTYLLFERSDGSQIVVRGGPDARSEGNDIANFAQSTLFGSEKFGNIRVDAAPYMPPYHAVYQRQADGSVLPMPVDQVNADDPALIRDKNGKALVLLQESPDWPREGENHERLIVWQGSDQELDRRLGLTLTAGQQINDAQLEYSPLYNNSNGVVSTLLKAADIAPSLPLDSSGKKVSAPNFGENLHQSIGVISYRSGYWFDGKQWYDSDDRKIQPPQSEEPVVPLDPNDRGKSRWDSSDSSFSSSQEGQQQGKQVFTTGDPELDKLAAAVFADDNAAFDQAVAHISQSPEVRAFEQWGHELAVAQQKEELQRQEVAQQGLVMKM
ncbi:MAG: hypothetical protein Q4G70_02970 [Pseudomonadota bacterium]|nr:hypothetical protein [Pseudomonadota bacterium]